MTYLVLHGEYKSRSQSPWKCCDFPAAHRPSGSSGIGSKAGLEPSSPDVRAASRAARIGSAKAADACFRRPHAVILIAEQAIPLLDPAPGGNPVTRPDPRNALSAPARLGRFDRRSSAIAFGPRGGERRAQGRTGRLWRPGKRRGGQCPERGPANATGGDGGSVSREPPRQPGKPPPDQAQPGGGGRRPLLHRLRRLPQRDRLRPTWCCWPCPPFSIPRISRRASTPASTFSARRSTPSTRRACTWCWQAGEDGRSRRGLASSPAWPGATTPACGRP